MQAQVRSFIAIELPDELKSGLAKLQARLKSGGQFPAKWVDPYNIHLTLKFLGNIKLDRIDSITGAMATAALGISPFQLQVTGLGVFPNPNRAQIAWVGIEGDIDRLEQLQQRLESNLVPLGFAPESRGFTPHLTLARLRDGASPGEREAFGQLIVRTGFEMPCDFRVSAVNLMRSQLTREGAIYSRIGTIELV